MSLVEKAAPKVHRSTKNRKGQKKNEIAMDHRWLQRPLTGPYRKGRMLRESSSGRNRTRDQHAKRGAPILLEIPLAFVYRGNDRDLKVFDEGGAIA
jgi:hypothetical protein